jgi:hypothetical protein
MTELVMEMNALELSMAQNAFEKDVDMPQEAVNLKVDFKFGDYFK